MAVKKKAPAKKKTAVKKVTKKAVAKKSPAKKKTAAKKVTKKAVAKKSPAKKKAAAKKVTKKVAKKSPAKKSPAKKKTAAKKSTSASKIVIPPVPLGGSKSGSRVNVSTTPAPVKSAPAKPSATPKQGTSPRVLIAAIIGIALLAAIVISRPSTEDDAAAPAIPSASATASATATPEMSEAATEAVATVEAPSHFIGNWKDAAHSVMSITWKAPAATAGLTGYKFEIRSGMNGEWKEYGMLPATQLSVQLTKGSKKGETHFRVSSVYSDGQIVPVAEDKEFGFGGQFA